MLSNVKFTESKKDSYPCLMVNTITGMVILCDKRSHGTVVNTGRNPGFKIGDTDFWSMQDFTVMPAGSSVTLTQE